MRLDSRAVLLIALVAGIAGGAWLLDPGRPRAARPTSGKTIVAFGDSLVAGRGATDGRDFVSLLSRRLRTPIINAGRNGDTTGSALDRLDRDVLAHDPRIVIVLLGGNDFLRRVRVEDTFAQLQAIVDRLRGHGAAVVVVGVSVGLFSDPYGERYEEVARRAGAGLVPDILDGILGRADRLSDSIHPNDRGYEMMADRVEPALRELLRTD